MIIRELIGFIIGLLPIIEFPAQLLSSFANAVNWVSIVCHYIPVGTFILCVGVYLTVFVVCAVISGILQVL